MTRRYLAAAFAIVLAGCSPAANRRDQLTDAADDAVDSSERVKKIESKVSRLEGDLERTTAVAQAASNLAAADKRYTDSIAEDQEKLRKAYNDHLQTLHRSGE